jgi:hypothetical protein
LPSNCENLFSYEVVNLTKGKGHSVSTGTSDSKNGKYMITDRKGRERKRRIIRTFVTSIVNVLQEDVQYEKFGTCPAYLISASGLHILTRQLN